MKPPTDLAREALGVPLGIKSSYEALHDGFVTALAARGIVLIVALATERLLVFLMESIRAKLLATQRTEEMLRVPGFFQCTHHTLEGGRENWEKGKVGQGRCWVQ